MVGKALLLECLDDQQVEQVVSLARRKLDMEHPKLKELIITDFFDLTPHKKELADYDICYFCLGVSAAGMKEAAYTHITYELTMRFARSLLSINPEISFSYVSGAGTDSTEKGRSMWARVKGKTENDLLDLPFRSAYMLRPAFIQPMKGIRSRTPLYNAVYAVFKPIYPLVKGMKKYVISSDALGRALIRLGIEGHEKKVLENADLRKLGG